MHLPKEIFKQSFRGRRSAAEQVIAETSINSGRKRGGRSMQVQLGDDASVDARSIIALIDVGSLAREPSTRRFIELAKEGRRLKLAGEGPVATYVVTDTCVYASPLTPATLRKRLEDGPDFGPDAITFRAGKRTI